MLPVTCDMCGDSFHFDPATVGHPTRVPGIGNLVTVICIQCGKILTVKLADRSPTSSLTTRKAH
jgi:hypothetical protein